MSWWNIKCAAILPIWRPNPKCPFDRIPGEAYYDGTVEPEVQLVSYMDNLPLEEFAGRSSEPDEPEENPEEDPEEDPEDEEDDPEDEEDDPEEDSDYCSCCESDDDDDEDSEYCSCSDTEDEYEDGDEEEDEDAD